MSDQVERIMAQKDMRELTVGVVSQSGEMSTAHRQALILEIGTIVRSEGGVKGEHQRDRSGFEDLRAMALQPIRGAKQG